MFCRVVVCGALRVKTHVAHSAARAAVGRGALLGIFLSLTTRASASGARPQLVLVKMDRDAPVATKPMLLIDAYCVNFALGLQKAS